MMNQPEQMAWESLQHGKRERRIAILVLGCRLPVYDRCIKAIRATWGSGSRESVDVFYVYGGQSAGTDLEMVSIEKLIGQARPELQDHQAWVSGDIILCGAGDVYAEQQDCILRKRLIAFGYLANQQHYDFVYTVCASSYVDVDALQGYVGSLPTAGVYQGPLGIYPASGYPFVSGASMLLSRDLAAALSNNIDAIISANTDNKPDDVAIGHWITDQFCAQSAAEISRRIAAAEKATNNHAFALPYGQGLIDYVRSPAHLQVPQERGYHYHFHSRRIWEMEEFHHRFFNAR